MLRIRKASSAPTISFIRSKLMFSSCVPSSALLAGVKIGSGSLLAICSPRGSSMPQTSPVR